MIWRMSSLFLRTLREDPADAEVPSHKLLVRGGYVRRVAPGIYSWLPLGKQVLENVTRVVREEMDRMGGQEVQFPALLPREYYEATGRWTEYGDNLFRLQDRRGNDYLLGPTHEEMFTDMVKGEVSSYKDLPVTLYQIQTKYRDEARPRAGILRGREFLMKDSYSFDLDDEGLKHSYAQHRDTYIRIFDRLGIKYKIVSAVSGAMGGSASEEFLATAPTGEDTYVACHNCGYAANVEAVETAVPPARDAAAQPALRILDTPDTPTIDSLVAVVNGLGIEIEAKDTLKNVVVKVRYPGVKEPKVLIVGVPGDREVDLKRLEAAVAPGEVELFEAEDFAKHPKLVRGYIGPVGMKEAGYEYLVDPRVALGTAWVTGANEAGKHVAYAVAGRDFDIEGTVEAAEVRAGDLCPRCGHELSIDRGIEIGHIFQLGRKYADVAKLDVLGKDGKPARVTMGSYGVGVSRAVAVLAEQLHDELGLVWPREVAPADVHIVAAGKDQTIYETANRYAEELGARGVRVLYDDRMGSVSPGVKFKDAELIGIPTIIVVGRNLADGVVEVRDRRSGEKTEVAVPDLVEHVYALVRG
ncbi:proline--tRNA ligase [Catenulispora pinisilvae]|uniref:proline--tRNA ligase n=1 Tax=Catenulispora pinisilvae TaxID=2705253 RepID=UPI0018911EA1|nr:proline--tRNA ligase [Catenulispora pinisilvae]